MAQTQTNSVAKFPNGFDPKKSKLSFRIIAAPNNTWCYDILNNGKLFIHQPSVPGMAGNEGFKTKEQAIKVAEQVMKKLKMLPEMQKILFKRLMSQRKLKKVTTSDSVFNLF